MVNSKNSYKEIVKTTSIFGGVQVFNIILAIARSKLVAILLGPAGMGIAGLYNSTIALITSITNFGLSTSAVKNVSAAYALNDDVRLGKIVAVTKRMVWLTGMLGFVATLALAPWLSQITFGNKGYTIGFMLVSITLLLTQLSAGQTVILRGTRKIQYMAKSSMIGALLGLITSIPLYYFWGKGGIVPALIITSVTGFLLTWYFSSKVTVHKHKADKELILTEGVDMLKMGFMISLSGLINLGESFLVRIYVNKVGGINEVGLYVAGFSLINTYVGMIFTAMSTDYYPRLAAVSHDDKLCKNEINQQAEIALLIIAPVIIIFLVFIKWTVILLYSAKFIPISAMLMWAVFGIFFKTASWAIGYIILAKGANKSFFVNELVSNVYMLILSVVGYNIWGLTGLGIAFLLSYVFHLIQMYVVSNWFYSFTFDKTFIKIFVIQFAFALICFLVQFAPLAEPFKYVVGIGVIIISCFFSYKQLDKMISISQVIKKILRKK